MCLFELVAVWVERFVCSTTEPCGLCGGDRYATASYVCGECELAYCKQCDIEHAYTHDYDSRSHAGTPGGSSDPKQIRVPSKIP